MNPKASAPQRSEGCIEGARRPAGPRILNRALAVRSIFGAILLGASSSQAAFHLWSIREVYSDASGTNQFIEFFTSSGNQQFVGGQQIRVTSPTATNTFTLPSNLPSDSAGKAFLIGTASITGFGAPARDFTISNNFLFTGGGTITFFGANSGPYTALPTDGVNSRTWTGGNAVNSPQNFAGQIGNINLNTPPTVSITNPLNNALFASPGMVLIGISATDNGSVANVQLLTNGVVAATNTVAPFGFTLSNLAAGYYTLRARAQDNLAASATSAPVTVRVASQPVLSVSPGSNGPLQFQFNSATGISYVVDRSQPLTNFTPVVTNAGSGGVLQFSETNAIPAQRTYRLRLQ